CYLRVLGASHRLRCCSPRGATKTSWTSRSLFCSSRGNGSPSRPGSRVSSWHVCRHDQPPLAARTAAGLVLVLLLLFRWPVMMLLAHVAQGRDDDDRGNALLGLRRGRHCSRRRLVRLERRSGRVVAASVSRGTSCGGSAPRFLRGGGYYCCHCCCRWRCCCCRRCRR
ncbi:unnamed protein product, partial [Ectocarpus sp. 12 AP-2014]